MKKFIITIALIGLIIIVVLLCTKTKPPMDKTNTENKNTLTTNVQKNEQIVDNNTEIQNTVNEENNTNTENKNEIANVQTNTISSETFTEEPKSEQEKAIELVKKDRENISSENYVVEGINPDGTYTISVRDKATTKALAFYTVDLTNKTFTKREMN